MLDHSYAVIMAGGGGTRLWPLSRQSRPKQMLALIDDRSLFQVAVDRLEGLFPPERILVVTVADQARELMAQSPQIPAENFILEPHPRGTASVVGLAAVVLAHRDPQALMAVLTSDHFIADEPRFRALLAAGLEVADSGFLVTLGITPTYPATGYGYIQSGAYLGNYRGLDAFHVQRFKEKPDLDSARAFIKAGDHAWNSGMFLWKVARVMGEFERQMPDLYAGLDRIAGAWGSDRQDQIVQEVWKGLRPQTIDYGIMEDAQQVAVLPGHGLGWNDVGSWDALFEVLPADGQGNILMDEDPVVLDTRNSLVYNDCRQRLIVLIGVDGLVVVDTEDVLLVCRKEEAQQVRAVVRQLQKQKRKNYL